MSEPAIEVKDPSRLRCLVIPPSQRSGARGGGPSGGGVASLLTTGPIEMATRSVQFPPCRGGAGSQPPSVSGPGQAGPSLGPGKDAGADPLLLLLLAVPGSFVPAVYSVCGLWLGLCNLVAPGYIQACAHLLCPAWSLALALHIVSGCEGRGCWAWCGVLTLLLLPFVILIGSALFVCFYLFMFALFSSGVFWRRMQGVHFICVWLCWGGFFLSCGLGFGTVPVHMHLSVAAFFAIALGVLNSACGGVGAIQITGRAAACTPPV